MAQDPLGPLAHQPDAAALVEAYQVPGAKPAVCVGADLLGCRVA
ncbi:hypothetical protein [Streptomyces sp. 6N223]